MGLRRRAPGLRFAAAAILALVLITVVVLFVALIRSTVSRQQEWFAGRAHAEASWLAGAADRHIRQGRQELEVIAGLPGIVFGMLGPDTEAEWIAATREGRAPPQFETLHYLLMGTPFEEEVVLIGESGRVLFREPMQRAQIGALRADQPEVADVLAGAPVSRVVSAGPGDPPMLVIGVPIAPTGGRAAGALLGTLDLSRLALVPAGGAALGATAYLVDDEGRVLASNREVAPEVLVDAPRDDQARLVPARGVMSATVALESAPLRLVLEVPWAPLLTGQLAKTKTLLLAGLGVLVILLALAYLSFSRFLVPLVALTDVARDIADGRMLTELPTSSPGEVGKLVKAFGRMQAAVRDAFRAVVRALVAALDARERETRHHSERVTGLSTMLAAEVGIEGQDLLDVEMGALLHDVGKIGIPDAILLKPGKLTDHEWHEMRRHPVIGAEILAEVPVLERASPVVASHHERWDGDGYPEGLRGEQIPIGARIFAVADTVDAITHDRPYRKARGLEVAIAEVEACSGGQFDPAVVRAFLSLPVGRIAEVMQVGVPHLAEIERVEGGQPTSIRRVK